MDVNTHRMWFTDVNGSSSKFTNLFNNQFGPSASIMWPTCICVRASSSIDTIEVFVAEYLGKLLHFTIPTAEIIQSNIGSDIMPTLEFETNYSLIALKRQR